jgi:hypothetical protein
MTSAAAGFTSISIWLCFTLQCFMSAFTSYRPQHPLSSRLAHLYLVLITLLEALCDTQPPHVCHKGKEAKATCSVGQGQALVARPAALCQQCTA